MIQPKHTPIHHAHHAQPNPDDVNKKKGKLYVKDPSDQHVMREVNKNYEYTAEEGAIAKIFEERGIGNFISPGNPKIANPPMADRKAKKAHDHGKAKAHDHGKAKKAHDHGKAKAHDHGKAKKALDPNLPAKTNEKARGLPPLVKTEGKELDPNLPAKTNEKELDPQNSIHKDFLTNKYSLSPPFEISNFTKNPAVINDLISVIEEYNKSSTTKIHLEKNSDGRLFLLHTKFEMEAFMQDCPQLSPFFTNGFRKSCFGTKSTANLSDKGLAFYESDTNKELFSKFKDQYSKIPIQEQPKLELPKFGHFSGRKEEVAQVFKSMLSNSKGIIIGEEHSEKAPKEVLKEQMHNLQKEGVKTLFLEHCCYDTLQPELDEFYRTKKASPFLKNFLSNGCGGSVGKTDYYKLVEAAVKAGIRPVGIELSASQLIGFKAQGGAQGEERYMGMNVPAKEIIEREAGDGKYIALVGSGHVSYCEDVAGLSELCGAAAMVISDKKKSDHPTYKTNQKFLGFHKDIEKLFGKSKKPHFTQVHLYM